jgi:hypothetical protein
MTVLCCGGSRGSKPAVALISAIFIASDAAPTRPKSIATVVERSMMRILKAD